MTRCVFPLVILIAVGVSFVTFGQPADSYQFGTVPNLNITDWPVYYASSATEKICANIYIFDQNQQLVECCSGPLLPNKFYFSYSRRDLVSNTIVPGAPSSITIKLLASSPIPGGVCNALSPNAGNLVSGLRTSLGSPPGLTGAPLFQTSTPSASDINTLTTFCSFLAGSGGFGICRTLRDPVGAFDLAAGAVSAWGSNQFGQLGNGSDNNKNNTPAVVNGLTGVIAVANGTYHTLALKSDGTVWAWGSNDAGELGNASTTESATPVQVNGLTNVIAIAGGIERSLALKSDGTVWAWGWNANGQLGLGTVDFGSTVPVQVPGLTGVIAIASGLYHSLALTSDGKVWAWGGNYYGQVGNGTMSFATSSPVQVSGLTNVVAIAGGYYHSLAATSDGTVWAWGRNDSGQLGNGTTANEGGPGGTLGDQSTPVPVLGLTGVTSVACGSSHSLALKSDGTVWAWGDNSNGQLGSGATNLGSNLPVAVNGVSNVKAIAAGIFHSMALKGDSTVWTWGSNFLGQLGNSTNTDSKTPVQAIVGRAVAIAAIGNHSVALTTTPPPVAVTIASSPAGLGFSVTGTGCQPGSYTTPHTSSWGPATNCGITFASPQDGTTGIRYVFNSWADSPGALNSRTLTTPAAASTYTANFDTQYLLTADANPNGGGMISGAGWYNRSSTATVQAFPAGGYGFSSWTGASSSGPATGTVVMDGPKSVTGNFAALTSISVSAVPSGRTFTVDGSDYTAAQTFFWAPGSLHTIATTSPQLSGAATRYIFANWSDGGAISHAINTPNVATTYTASFATQYLLTTTVAGPFGAAAGSISPASGWYNNKSLVTVSATANPRFAFTGFDGDLIVITSPQLLGITGPRIVNANFALARPTTAAPVAAWGGNGSGLLGDGTTKSRNLPVTVLNLPDATAIAAGVSGSVALKSDGTVWQWGENYPSQTINLTPSAVSGLTGVVAIAAGDFHRLALKSDGTVWAWGANAHGALGNGTNTASEFPVAVINLTGVVAIAAASEHNLALKVDGTVWSWGQNSFGLLGNGTTIDTNTAVAVTGLPGPMSAIATGLDHCLALDSNGTAVWAWGGNGQGQLGTGNYNDTTTPLPVIGLTGVKSVSGGGAHSLALKTDGTVWAWGYNASGQLGNGSKVTTNKPGLVGLSSVATAISAGYGHSLASTVDGYAWAWGDNGTGQLGSGPGPNSKVPILVSNLSSASAITAAVFHSLALGTVSAPSGVVTIVSTPPGLAFKVSGGGCQPGTYVTPLTLNWLPNSSCTVKFDSPLDGTTGTRYVFDKWTDDATAQSSRTLPAPATTATYTANYITQYQLTTAADPGPAGNVTGAGWFNGGTVATVTASANKGYIFQSWTGAATSSVLTGTVTMDGPKTVTGNFAVVVPVTVNTSPAGRSFTVDNTTYTTAQTFSWVPGTKHLIATSSPQPGAAGTQYVFGTWSDNGTLSHPVITPTAAVTFTANFTTQYLLTTLANPSAGGTVSGGGWYNASSITLASATPNSGYVFSSWTGVGGALGVSGPIVMNGPKTVTANFTALVRVLVNTSPQGLTFVADSATYTAPQIFFWVPGSTHPMSTVSPQAGGSGTQYVFSSWSDGGAQSHKVTIPASGGQYTINFDTQYMLTTSVAPFGNPAGTIAPASGWQPAGAVVPVSSSVNAGFRFFGYSGDLTATTTAQSLTMNGPKNVIANFRLQAPSAAGSLFAWGVNNSGMLGDGTLTNRNKPVPVANFSDAVAVSAGAVFSLALRSNGTVWAWGFNLDGELGNGTYTNSTTPVQVSGLTDVVAISAGPFGLALKSDGTVWAWGSNITGGLGDGTFTTRNIPAPVSGLTAVVAISAGFGHALALKADGTVVAWGENTDGQLGIGTKQNSTVPVPISGLSGVMAIAGGSYHSLALLKNGTVMSWGNNDYGQLGNGTNTATNTPAPISGLTNIVAIAGGTLHSLVLTNGGAVWAFGNNTWGQIGNGTNTTTYTPVHVPGLTGVVAVACGEDHSLALMSGGKLQAWGFNFNGELGDGSNTNRNKPVAVVGLSGVILLNSGSHGHHSLAVKQ